MFQSLIGSLTLLNTSVVTRLYNVVLLLAFSMKTNKDTVMQASPSIENPHVFGSFRYLQPVDGHFISGFASSSEVSRLVHAFVGR